jgi:casein kinase II subunit beta
MDGAFFGPTFPHLFEMAYADQILHRYQEKERRIFVPKIYGFKVHETSIAGSKSAWLREV